jgi:hypothetical protein
MDPTQTSTGDIPQVPQSASTGGTTSAFASAPSQTFQGQQGTFAPQSRGRGSGATAKTILPGYRSPYGSGMGFVAPRGGSGYWIGSDEYDPTLGLTSGATQTWSVQQAPERPSAVIQRNPWGQLDFTPADIMAQTRQQIQDGQIPVPSYSSTQEKIWQLAKSRKDGGPVTQAANFFAQMRQQESSGGGRREDLAYLEQLGKGLATSQGGASVTQQNPPIAPNGEGSGLVDPRTKRLRPNPQGSASATRFPFEDIDPSLFQGSQQLPPGNIPSATQVNPFANPDVPEDQAYRQPQYSRLGYGQQGGAYAQTRRQSYAGSRNGGQGAWSGLGYGQARRQSGGFGTSGNYNAYGQTRRQSGGFGTHNAFGQARRQSGGFGTSGNYNAYGQTRRQSGGFGTSGNYNAYGQTRRQSGGFGTSDNYNAYGQTRRQSGLQRKNYADQFGPGGYQGQQNGGTVGSMLGNIANQPLLPSGFNQFQRQYGY